MQTGEAAPARKRSRWGAKEEASNNDTGTANNDHSATDGGEDAENKRRRKSKVRVFTRLHASSVEAHGFEST
jgi:hypothetical protein